MRLHGVAAALAVVGSCAFAGEAERLDYPIKNASFASARATGGFWFDRLETNRVSTLATDWAKCAETPRIANLTNAAARALGTFSGNPFDDSDRLRITAFSISRTRGTAALSFEYVGGHVYGVNTTTNLTNPTWLSQKIRTSETGEEFALVAPSADLDDVGTNTIYMTPAMDAPQGFFWLEAK